MPIQFTPPKKPVSVQDLEAGDIALISYKGGYLITLSGLIAAEPAIIILGTIKTEYPDQTPLWVFRSSLGSRSAIKLENVDLDLLPEEGSLGIAIPSETTENGDIVVDNAGAGFFYLAGGPEGMMAFNVVTGTAKGPPSPRTTYRKWALMLRHEDGRREMIFQS